MNKQQFLNKVELLNSAAKTYYADGDQIMTDAEYDYLLSEVESTAKLNKWTEADSLLKTVAAGFTGKGKSVTHSKPMLSMEKVKSITELTTFTNKVKDFSLEPKIDGLAISLTYSKGKLIEAATRGDGITGETILAVLLKTRIKNLPITLSEKLDIEVRGELYMTYEDFEIANAERKALSNKWKDSKKGGTNDKFSQFVNPRNATAGIIRNEKQGEANQPNPQLSFAAYDAIGFDNKNSLEDMKALSNLGFVTSIDLTPKLTGSLEKKVSQFKDLIPSLGFPVDGVVLKATSFEVRKRLGEGNKTPKWSMAYKYNDAQKVTRLLDIEVAVNRTGAISYTAIVEPVELEGTIVTKSTLNNASYIADNNVRIGGNVIIEKANQIIPRIVAGVDNSSNPVYKPATNCPNCSEDLDTSSSIIWRCANPDCSIASAITYWSSRDIMDIDGLGGALVDNLVENNLVNTVADLYKLKASDLENLTVFVNSQGTQVPFGNKRSVELIKQIESSRNQPLNRVLSGLNIRFLGRRLGKTLANHFGSIEAIQKAKVSELSSIDMIGDIKAEAIFNGIIAKKGLITELKKVGVSMKASTVPVVSNVAGADWIAGKKFVITGSFDGFNRDALTTKLESMGGKSSSSVSGSTEVLICGEKAGSKKAKAESLNIRIIEESELTKLMN